MTDQAGKGAAPETAQEIDRIRDIIFGPNMRDYEQRFQVFQRDLERLQQELERLIEQQADQGQEQGKKLQDLRREMRQANDDLRAEVRETAQNLINDKVDRVALGELFIELGTRLKTGGSVADLLKELGAAEAE